MITSSELIEVLRSFLQASPLAAEINGHIYPRTRPTNSTKEDVVINSVATTNEQVQSSLLNVNVFVPDMDVRIDGVQQKMADSARLEVLEAMACNILKSASVKKGDDTIIFGVQQTNGFADESAPQHYINIRTQFYITNIN